jgi:hypothetical protein
MADLIQKIYLMKKKEILRFAVIITIFSMSCVMLSSCANMRMATNYGVNIHGGPGGMQVDPYFNMNFYNGGPRY